MCRSFSFQHRAIQIVAFTVVLVHLGCKRTPLPGPTPLPTSQILGADLSQLPKVEAENFSYYNSDSLAVDPIALLAVNGANTVRLKVWNNAVGDASLAELVPLVQRIHAHDLKVMLTLHYSNTWADPGAQALPSQWDNLPFDLLLDSVEDFTFKVVELLHPAYVQIGNEINHGLMHPAGLRDGSGNFQQLLAAGLRGAKRADSTCTTLLHYAGYEQAFEFFSALDTLNFDAAGLSYYPRWHGDELGELAQTIATVQRTLNRPCFIVETSYPFTLLWNDWTNNHIGSSDQLHPDYEATPEGQLRFIADLRTLTDTLESGLLYWGGELVAYKGSTATDGSPYENQALFNFNGVELPALTALVAP